LKANSTSHLQETAKPLAHHVRKSIVQLTAIVRDHILYFTRCIGWTHTAAPSVGRASNQTCTL